MVRRTTCEARRLQPFISAAAGNVVTRLTEEGILDHGSLLGLEDDDHPQYASANGAGIRAAYAAERLNKSVLPGFGLSGGGVLTENRTLAVDAVDDPGTEARVLKSSAAGKLTLRGLTLRGDLLPSAPDTINIGSSSSPFLAGHISEMYGTRFIEETISVAGGHWIIPKSSATLAVEMDAVTTSLITIDNVGSDKVDAQGNVSRTGWSTGDYLVFRDIDKYERMRIISGSGTTWTVARDVDGSGANTWGAGSTVANLGKSGDGWLSFQGGRDYGLSIWERYGTNPGDVTNFLRAGNLRNWNGYPSADLPGFGLGDSERFISFDRTHGLRIQSPVVIGGNLGFTTDALLYLPFDGPKPYASEFGGSAVGHLGQTPTLTGGVIYRAGKWGKAAQFAEATTNLLRRGSFEVGGPLDGWANVSGNFPQGYAIDTERALYGRRAGRFRFDADTVVRGMVQSFIASEAGDYTFSGYIWILDYTQGTLSFDLGGPPRAQFSAATGGWVPFSVTRTLSAGTNFARIFTDSTPKLAGRFLLDGLQVEQKAYNTPYCDGSMGAGYSWSGTPFDSTSTRMGANLSYTRPVEIGDKFTACAWIYFRSGSGASSNARTIFHGNDALSNNAHFFLRTTDDLLTGYWNGTYIEGVTTVPRDAWAHVAMTMDGSSLKLYLNGALENSVAASGALDATHTQIIVGSVPGAPNTNSLNGLLDDFVLMDRALTAAEIKAIYDSGAALNIRRGPFDLYLGGGASGGWLVGNGDGLAGYSSDGTKQAWFGSDGMLYAGNGNAAINKNGIEIIAEDLKGSKISWINRGAFGGSDDTPIFEIEAYVNTLPPIHGVAKLKSDNSIEFVTNAYGSNPGSLSMGYESFFGDYNFANFNNMQVKINGKLGINGATPQGKRNMGGAAAATTADLQTKLNALRQILIDYGFLSN